MSSELLQSKVLVRYGFPIIGVKWAPAATALIGVIGGTLVKRKFHYPNLGTGMIAAGVAVGISSVIAMVLSRTVGASTAAATAAENSGMGPQAVAGFGFGRVFAGGLRGLGRVPGQRMLFGAGTPNMAGARMFNGATVAIEQPGLLSGATVAIEPSNRFAGALS